MRILMVTAIISSMVSAGLPTAQAADFGTVYLPPSNPGFSYYETQRQINQNRMMELEIQRQQEELAWRREQRAQQFYTQPAPQYAPYQGPPARPQIGNCRLPDGRIVVC